MRSSNYWLLGGVLFLNGACGARTGDLGDTSDAGLLGSTGGAGNSFGGSPWVATGGMPGAGGWYPNGGYSTYVTCPQGEWGCSCYAGNYCNYPYSCSYGTCTYNTVTTGGATSCPTGSWGCSCYAGNYCNYPYSCSYGTCTNNTVTTGGTTSCSLGSWGCSCYAGSYCNYPYSCSYGTCIYTNVTTGGASWGGATSSCPTGSPGCPCFAWGTCYSPSVCSNGYCQYPVTTGGRPSYGGTGAYPTGGRPSFGGSSITTGGVSPVMNCVDSVTTCANDAECKAILTCISGSIGTCSTNLACYLNSCQNVLMVPSASLALQIITNCSSAIGL
jgi:hypothetical protein